MGVLESRTGKLHLVDPPRGLGTGHFGSKFVDRFTAAGCEALDIAASTNCGILFCELWYLAVAVNWESCVGVLI